jgi:5-methylcytosine-specific restriction protein A
MRFDILDRLRGRIPLFARPRSTHWPAVRARYLRMHPTCAACGRADHLQVHHIIPFHIDREKELVPTNLITLCETWTDSRCHLEVGHLGDWHQWNPQVAKDAKSRLKSASK